MADIFISYASQDQARIRPLVAALEGAGYSVWWDHDLVGGSRFSKEIEAELVAAAPRYLLADLPKDHPAVRFAEKVNPQHGRVPAGSRRILRSDGVPPWVLGAGDEASIATPPAARRTPVRTCRV